jgi:hypothetical protein
LQRGFAHDFAKVPVHSHDHGDPLPGALRARMQAQLGHDFSGVRVHTGPEADQAVREVAAVAFTVGDDVYLGADADRRGSADGDRLLMHELAHVVQQREAPDLADGVSAPGDATERAAHTVAAGGSLVRAAGTVAAAQRQATMGMEKQAVTRAAVQAALTDYLTKVMQEQGGRSLQKTEQVKATVLKLFKDTPQGTMWVQDWLDHTMLGDPAEFAAQVVSFLPDVIPAENLGALQHGPAKQTPGRPKTLEETIRGGIKEQLGKIGQPQQGGAGSPSDRALPPSTAPAPPAQSPGQHMIPSPKMPWEFRWGKPPPKPSRPQAEPDPLAESVAARVDPGALVPAGVRDTADFPDAQEFARDVARRLDAAQKAKTYTVYLELGANYANVKDLGAICRSAQQIVLAIRDALPHHASEVTEVWLTVNQRRVFPVWLHPSG